MIILSQDLFITPQSFCIHTFCLSVNFNSICFELLFDITRTSWNKKMLWSFCGFLYSGHNFYFPVFFHWLLLYVGWLDWQRPSQASLCPTPTWGFCQSSKYALLPHIHLLQAHTKARRANQVTRFGSNILRPILTPRLMLELWDRECHLSFPISNCAPALMHAIEEQNFSGRSLKIFFFKSLVFAKGW